MLIKIRDYILDKLNLTVKNKKSIAELSNPDLSYVYTDKSGINYYEYKDPLQMPIQRYIEFGNAMVSAQLNMDKKEIIGKLNEILDQCNKGMLSQVVIITHLLKNYLSYDVAEKTLFTVASCYYVCDGEDLKGFNQHYQNMKVERWKKDEEARAFFLRKAVIICPHLVNDFENYILEYLKTHEMQILIADSMLRSTKYRGDSKS